MTPLPNPFSKPKRTAPTCSYCKEIHWPFDPCDERKKRFGKQPQVQWGKSMEGARLFGDRVENFELLGGQNLVLKKEKGS